MYMIKGILLSVLLFGFQSLNAGQVNINQADIETLSTELTGVGVKKAQAIVDYRTQNGPFKSAEELQNVKGISIKTIEKNRQNINL